MLSRSIGAAAAMLLSSTLLGLYAQQTQPSPTVATVPRLVRIASVFRPASGQPVPVESVTLSIYKDEHDPAPLWQETQNVALDAEGRYTVLMGASLSDGMPLELFSGEPRWLGVQFNRPGEIEQPRVLLVSVPYALKAADADTLGGKPASAYLLSPADTARNEKLESAGNKRSKSSDVPEVFSQTSGTSGYIAKFINTTDLGNSVMYDNGGLVGVGTTSPLDRVHSQFTDTSGAVTGYAVQNLGSGAASYSGMLFYDQNGALGQFQGFNNSTHEYRINNIASGGSINFMIGSSSKFLVADNGNITVGNGNLGIGSSTGLSRLTARGKPSFTATGTVTTDGTTTISGTGTKFLSEIGIGDRIQIPSGTGATSTVGSIQSDTALTTLAPLTTGTAQSMGVFPGLFRVETSTGGVGLRVTDQGNVHIGILSALSGSNPKVLVAAGSPFTGTSTMFATTSSGEGLTNSLIRTTTTQAADVGPVLGFSGQNGSTQNLFAGVRGAKENGTLGDFSGYLGLYTTQGGSPNTFAERMRISSAGNVGIGTTTPNAKLEVAGGDVNISNAGSGIILKSPDGTKCARISMDNSGTLVTTSLTCP